MLPQQVIQTLRDIITQIKEIRICYLFGSSLKRQDFNDIDLGILLTNSDSSYQASKFAMSLGRKFERALKFKWEFDVKILNYAPIHFQYSVIKQGMLLYYCGEKERILYETNVINLYLDYKDTLDWFNLQIMGRN